MCVIMWMKKGVIPPYDSFRNAVWNNPDGWGLLIKDNGRIDVQKDFDPKGNDPEKLYELVKKNADVERFLHLRYATDGAKDLENTQPFPVYSSNNRDIFFMHNGILHDYKPPLKHSPLYEEDDMKDASDSRRFAAQRLTPLLLRFRGENGAADIQDSYFQDVVAKYWSASSRGILISSDQDPHLINRAGWKRMVYKVKGKVPDPENPKKKIDGEIEQEFYASNDDYFDKLIRGPEFDRLKELERKKSEADRANSSIFNRGAAGANSREVKKLTSETFLSRYYIEPGKLGDLVNLADLYDDTNVAVLSSLSLIEVEEMMKSKPESAGMLFMFMSSMIAACVQDKDDALEEVAKARKACTDMKQKLTQYEAQVDGKGRAAA